MQVGAAAAVFDDAALQIEEALKERTLGNSRIIQQPLGVVAAITPWNFPLYQAALKVAPALAVGCTVVLKPSEVAPFTAAILAEVVSKADLPAGVFNLIHGTGIDVGEHLVSHPEIDAVTFTGSDVAGSRVAELAGRSIKPVTLELGGKNPHLILDCVNLEAAVAYSVASAFANNGQVCAALSRLIVPREYLPEVERLALAEVRKFAPGDPRDAQTRLGPLASEGQLNRLNDILARTIEEGTEILTGGLGRPGGLERELAGGFFATPTVFTNVAPGSVIDQEEAFGPVLAIVPYEGGADEGIRIANGTPYGLNAAVWSEDLDLANRAAARLHASTVYINGGNFNATAPFGGTKRSGFGRERGIAGLEEFIHTKSIQS
jgi:acyl-CoA reductase-like NAD-dependent aldehyde dehydrogenase